MINRERRHRILQHLRRKRYASIQEILSILQVSEATVRRDLNALESEGLINRVHGGAELRDAREISLVIDEPPFEQRKGERTEIKRKIARKAVEMCENHETIIIDGGSTTYHMSEFLLDRELEVITNSFAIADRLVHYSDNRIIILGGMIYPQSQLILNPFDYDSFLKNYYATKLFMGVGGIDENGATNSEMLLIETERAMIRQSKRLILLCDSTKFARQGNLFLCGFERIDTIITDEGIPTDQRTFLEKKEINVVVV